MDTLHVADAIDEVFALLRRSNKYIDETMPWALAKDESKQARLARCCTTCSKRSALPLLS